MTTDWKQDEEFISWTMNRTQMTREQVIACDCWSSTWDTWSAGRAVGERRHGGSSLIEMTTDRNELRAKVAELEELRKAQNDTILAMGDDRSKLKARVAELQKHLRRAVEAGTDHDGSRSYGHRITCMLETLDEDGWSAPDQSGKGESDGSTKA